MLELEETCALDKGKASVQGEKCFSLVYFGNHCAYEKDFKLTVGEEGQSDGRVSVKRGRSGRLTLPRLNGHLFERQREANG